VGDQSRSKMNLHEYHVVQIQISDKKKINTVPLVESPV